MGLSFGCTMIYNEKSVPMEEILSTLKTIIAEENERYMRAMKNGGLSYLLELGSVDYGVAIYKPNSPWVSTVTAQTSGGFGFAQIKDNVKMYAEAFGLPIMSISTFDSDILMIAFCNPGEEAKAYAASHYMDEIDPMLEEEGVTEENIVFPEPLRAFGTPEQIAPIEKLWGEDLTFIEDIAFAIAKAFGFAIALEENEYLKEMEAEGYICKVVKCDE